MLYPLGLSLVLLFVCLLSSCSEESTCVEMKPETVKPFVLSRCEAVNAKLLMEAPMKISSRGWSDWSFRQRAKVVMADLKGCRDGGKSGFNAGRNIGMAFGQPITGSVFGAVLGGAIVGSFRSWMAFPEIIEINDDEPAPDSHVDDFYAITELCKEYVMNGFFASDSVVIDEIIPNDCSVPQELLAMSGLSQNAIIVGKMHNLILATLDGRIDADAENVSKMGGPSKGDDDHDKFYSSVEEEIANSLEFVEQCRLTAMSDADDSDSVVDDILTLFVDMLENYSSECSDVAYVVGRYTQIIDQSTELTDDDKEQLKSALSTALYSSMYWSNRTEQVTNE